MFTDLLEEKIQAVVPNVKAQAVSELEIWSTSHSSVVSFYNIKVLG